MQDEEISLTDIVLRLWSRRGLLVAVPALLLAAMVVYILASMTTVVLPTVHYVELRAIEKGYYPSGAQFSPKDLIAPEVVAEVAHQAAVDPAGLRDTINVEYGTPGTSGIIAAYETKLSQRGLNAMDIERINADFQESLASANERGLRIIVNHGRLKLPPESGATIASLIPAVWSQVFSERYRIFVDRSLEGSAIRPELAGLETTSQILDAQDQLERVRKGLNIIGSDSRLAAITNEQGQNADDLQREANRFATLFFQPIYSYAFRATDEISGAYIRETVYKIAEIDKQILSLNNIANDIIRLNNNDAKAASYQKPAGGGGNTQLNADSLGQIIGLANKASLTDYLREIFEQRHQLLVQRTKLETQLAWTKEQTDVVVTGEFRDQAATIANEVFSSYSGLLRIARGRLKDRYSELYVSVGEPSSMRGSILPPKALLQLTLAAVAGLFLAAMLALVLPARELRRPLPDREAGQETDQETGEVPIPGRKLHIPQG